MGQIANSLPAGGMIFDSNTPGVLGPAVINAYTTLGIPAWWRAMNYVANNMAAFPRYVARDGVKAKHPLDVLLTRRPNSFQSAGMMFRTLFFHRAQYGNAYAEIERDKVRQAPTALIPHTPEWVMPFRFLADDGTISTYYHVAGDYGREAKILPAADMIHLTGLSWDGMTGMNPVTMLFEALERARLTDRYLTRSLVRGTVVKGSIELPAELSEDQEKQIVALIDRYFRGANAERDVVVLSGGAKLNNATLSNQDSQLMEQTAHVVKQISQITGVPPAYLYDDPDGKYNANVEQAGQMVVRDLFRPLLAQDTEELSFKLLTDQEAAAGYTIEFDDTALLKGDTVTESNTTLAQVTAGVISKNEGRAKLNYPKSNDPEADKLITLGATTQSPVPAAPTPRK